MNAYFTDLGVPLSKFLEHVGIDLLFLLLMFLHLALAAGKLNASCTIQGVDFQDLLKVFDSQAVVIAEKPCFPSTIQSLLVAHIMLNYLAQTNTGTWKNINMQQQINIARGRGVVLISTVIRVTQLTLLQLSTA